MANESWFFNEKPKRHSTSRWFEVRFFAILKPLAASHSETTVSLSCVMMALLPQRQSFFPVPQLSQC